jgi:alanine racemase
MDMLMVNITDINCNEGDEVILFDNQKTVNELAKNINSISYEILTAISQRVKRIVK